jgi:hypothetical protein
MARAAQAAELPNLPEGSAELRSAHTNLLNIRRALARPDFRPGRASLGSAGARERLPPSRVGRSLLAAISPGQDAVRRGLSDAEFRSRTCIVVVAHTHKTRMNKARLGQFLILIRLREMLCEAICLPKEEPDIVHRDVFMPDILQHKFCLTQQVYCAQGIAVPFGAMTSFRASYKNFAELGADDH